MRREPTVGIHFRTRDYQDFILVFRGHKEPHVSGDLFRLAVILAKPEIGAGVTAVMSRNHKGCIGLVEPLEDPGVLKLLSERAKQPRALRWFFRDLI